MEIPIVGSRITVLLAIVWGAVLVLAGCGGGGGSGAPALAGGDTATAPTVTSDPASQSCIVGQSASLSVTALGTAPTYSWESSSDEGVSWGAIPSATGATLTLTGVSVADDQRRFRVIVSNSAGTITSSPAVLSVTWGSVVTSADLSSIDTFWGGGGDGGSSGGGDGAGADGGGGLGKTLNAQMTVTRLADGALVGQALTDGATGLVKIKAGPGTGPLLLTLTGSASATYYDEGKNALLPFGPDQVLHALVDQLDENVGVSAFTEAAYRYALNNFVADPAKIAAGTVPLLRTGSAVGLTKAQVQTANNSVLDAINRALPTGYQLVSLKALPTPVDATSGQGSVPNSRYGKNAAATGGFAILASTFALDTTAPALAVVEEISRDLTDGLVNGFALDGTPSSQPIAGQPSKPQYDAGRFPIALNVAANSFGQAKSSALLGVAPVVAEVDNFDVPVTAGTCFLYNYFTSTFALRRDGTVNALQREFFGACGVPTSTVSKQPLLTNVKQVASTGTTGAVVTLDGTVLTWGTAKCGLLGTGQTSGLVEDPVPINNLVNITQLLAIKQTDSEGGAVFARDSAGSVYSWGSDGVKPGDATQSAGHLGQGPLSRIVSCSSYDFTFTFPMIATATKITGLSDIASVQRLQSSYSGYTVSSMFAIDSQGTVFGWGTFTDTFLGNFPAAASGVVIQDVPKKIVGLEKIVSMSSGASVTFALQSNGSVVAFGPNTYGERGDGATNPIPAPSVVPLVGRTKEFGVSRLPVNRTMYALLEDGSLWSWIAGTTPTRVAGMPAIRHMVINFSARLYTESGAVLEQDGTGNFVDVTATYAGL